MSGYRQQQATDTRTVGRRAHSSLDPSFCSSERTMASCHQRRLPAKHATCCCCSDSCCGAVEANCRRVNISSEPRCVMDSTNLARSGQDLSMLADDRCQSSHQIPTDCQSRKKRTPMNFAIPFPQGLQTLKHMTCVLYITCLSGLAVLVASHPIGGVQYPGSKPSGHDFEYQPLPFDSSNYLAKFGYLPKSDMETGALRNASELNKAVKKFQRMAHLPVTGQLDQATIDKMYQPRCGMEDDIEPYFNLKTGSTRHKRYVLGPSTWPHKNLTYRYLSYTNDLHITEVHDAMSRAFKVWSDATELTFTEIYHGEADIMIQFARWYHHDGYPFDGQGMTLAHAFFPGPDLGGDIHFDEDEDWSYRSEEGVNLFTVAAHELGHSLGLGHSSVLGALMYPWYGGYMPQLTLHSDDLVAIQYLYGVGDPEVIPPSPPTPPTLPPIEPRTTSTTERPIHGEETHPTVPPPFTTRAPPRPTTLTPGLHPNPCTTDIDAAALIRQETYFFKGLWFWRIDKSGIMDGYPVEIERFWYGFPKDLKHVDAVYERVDDGKIVFFSGNRFWLFHGNHMDTGFPREGRPLTDMGFPDNIERVDAAFVWGYNMKTYLVTGRMYWRFNELLGRMDYDYPRDMSMWAGVPVPVDAAFQLWDGNTYFFQGRYFYKFKDDLMRIDYDRHYKEPVGTFWLECASDFLEPSAAPVDGASTAASVNYLHPITLNLTLLLYLLLC